tara:strand:+ start:628 stop:1008 length:381 start_codon:yes stop_codon:yes gene_type:complete
MTTDKIIQYCDHCAESEPTRFVGEMPVDFNSGNEGESASLCENCYAFLTHRTYKMEYGKKYIDDQILNNLDALHVNLIEATKLAVEALELCIKDSKEGTIMRSPKFTEAVSILKDQTKNKGKHGKL